MRRAPERLSGSVDFFDTTTGDDLGTVTLCGNAASLEHRQPDSGHSRDHGLVFRRQRTSSRAAASTSTLTINQSIIVLDPTASGALTSRGTRTSTLPGGVYVDSSSSSALSASGNALITASAIDVHGGVQKSGNATFSPAPDHEGGSCCRSAGRAPFASTTGLTNYGPKTSAGIPRRRSSLASTVRSSSRATPASRCAGLYIIEGAASGLRQRQCHRHRRDDLQCRQQVPEYGRHLRRDQPERQRDDQLDAATTGPFAGLLFIQPAANKQALTFSGNAMAGMTGTIYAPAAQLAESVNAQLNLALTSTRMTLSGNAVANVVTLTAPSRDSHLLGLSMPGAGLLQTPESSPLVGTAQSVPTAVTEAPHIAQAQGASDATFGLTTSESTLFSAVRARPIVLDGRCSAGPASPNAPPEAAREHELGFQANTWENEQNLIVEHTGPVHGPIRYSTNWLPLCGPRVVKRCIEPTLLRIVPRIHGDGCSGWAGRGTFGCGIPRSGPGGTDVAARTAQAGRQPRDAACPSVHGGGFCGLGLAAVQNPRAGRASFRRASISRPNSR